MPTIKSITISLDGGQEVYRPGEIINGTWTLSLGEALTVRGVRTYLHGAAYTRWSPLDPRKQDREGFELVTNQVCTVFGRQENESGPNPTLSAGVHQYRFSFQLPALALPSSYEGEYGAIRYWVAFRIDRPLLRFNTDRFKPITVLDHIDINDAEFCNPLMITREEKIGKVLGLGNQGSVTINVQLNRGGYCPGEKMVVSLTALNNSDRDLGKITGSLIQSAKFHARSDGLLGGSDEEKTTDIVLRAINDKEPLKKKTQRIWKDIPLTIEAVPPSTRIGTCHIITVSYFLRINVEMSLLHGGDITFYIPITIGTVPQTARRTSTVAGSRVSLETDLRSLITYTQCNKGFRSFTKSGQDFPETSYQPLCAYNPGFKFAESLKTSMYSRSLDTGQANVSNAPGGLQASAIQDALTEVATDAAMVVDSTGQIGRPQTRPRTTVSGRKSFMLMRLSESFFDDFLSVLKETKHLLETLEGRIIALTPHVTVEKGSWPPETSISVFVFNSDEDALRYYEEVTRKCSLYCFDIQEAIVGATKEEFQTGKRYFHCSLAEKVATANFQGPEWRRYIVLAGKQLISLRKQKGGVRLTDTKQRRLTSSQSNASLTLTQWDTEQQIHDFKDTVENDDQYKEIRELRQLFFTVATAVIFRTVDIN